MPGALGALTVSLALDAAQFFSALTKSQYELQKLNSNVETFQRGVKNAFAGLGVGLSVAGIVEFSRRTTEAAEDLRRLSADTGSSVEELSRLSNVAKVSGTSFETFQTALLRLSAGLNGSEELSTKTADALKFLGVTAKDPAAALQEVANKLNQYADGAGKAAIARDLFSRGGPAFIATLKAIAENTDQVNTKTAKQAEDAKNLAEGLRSLQVNSHQVADAILNELVPSLNAFVGALTDAIKFSDSLGGALQNLARLNPFASFGENISSLNAQIAAEQKNVDEGGRKFWSFLNPDFAKKSVDNSIKEIQRLTAARDIAKAGQARAALSIGTPEGNIDHGQFLRPGEKPTLGYVSGAAAQAQDAGRQVLLRDLAALDNYIKSEQDLLKQREHFLQTYYADDKISIADFYGTRQAIISEALANELAALDKEAQLISARIGQTKPSERAEDEKKLADVVAKRARAEQDAAFAGIEGSIEQARALRDYRDQVDEVNARMLELRGNTEAAAAIRFDAQTRSLRDKLSVNGDTGALAVVQFLREQEQITLSLGKAQRDYSNTLERTGIAASRIDLQQQTGAITEIDAINKKADLARQYTGELAAQADQYERIAKSLAAGPAQDAALIQMQKLRLEIEQVAAASDVLAKKFNDIFAGAFADVLVNLATGAKNLKDSIKDAEKQIVGSIARIAAQNVGEQLFGKNGPLGFVGQGFASIFGGGKDATGAAALAGAGATLTASGTALAGSAAALTGAAAALGGAALGKGAGDLLSGLFDQSSPFSALSGLFGIAAAGGGEPPLGRISIVGEHGPELFIPKTPGTIIPSDVLEARRNQKSITTHNTITVNVLPGATTGSAHQAAVAMARELKRAEAKNR